MVSSTQTSWPWGEEGGNEERREEPRREKGEAEEERNKGRGRWNRLMEVEGKRG